MIKQEENMMPSENYEWKNQQLEHTDKIISVTVWGNKHWLWKSYSCVWVHSAWPPSHWVTSAWRSFALHPSLSLHTKFPQFLWVTLSWGWGNKNHSESSLSHHSALFCNCMVDTEGNLIAVELQEMRSGAHKGDKDPQCHFQWLNTNRIFEWY